jgi:hypothetical protein
MLILCEDFQAHNLEISVQLQVLRGKKSWIFFFEIFVNTNPTHVEDKKVFWLLLGEVGYLFTMFLRHLHDMVD